MRALDRGTLWQKFSPPPQAQYMVETIFHERSGEVRREFRFYATGLRLLETRSMPASHYDPRTRPWYRAALGQSGTVLSDPCVFLSTGQVGISLSQASSVGEAIFGMDMPLDVIASNIDDLRLTASTEVALVDERDHVIAYRDMKRVLVVDGASVRLRSLGELGVGALSWLKRGATANDRFEPRDIDGREWLGISIPFDAFAGRTLRLLVLLFLPLGWWAGNAIGRRLEQTALRAGHMSRFDFSQRAAPAGPWRELNALTGVVSHVGTTVEAFLDISQTLGSEVRVEDMLAKVLEKLVQAMHCEGGAVYLCKSEVQEMHSAARYGEQGSMLGRFSYAADLSQSTTISCRRSSCSKTCRGRRIWRACRTLPPTTTRGWMARVTRAGCSPASSR